MQSIREYILSTVFVEHRYKEANIAKNTAECSLIATRCTSELKACLEFE